MGKTYVVGDVHGCLDAFDTMLELVKFNRKKDRLWLVGDIVNRGPDSLGMLRRAIKLERKMGDRFQMVLGNHEIHLLKVDLGLTELRAKDTLDDILEADDRGQLLAWLRQRPLVHFEDGYLVTHAGLLPHWSLGEAIATARKLEKRLRKGKGRKLLRPRSSSRALDTFTKVRMLDKRARTSPFNGEPEAAPKGLEPWFKQWVSLRSKEEQRLTVCFGHWAALGQRTGGKGSRRWISLDGGCTYGRTLCAIQLPGGSLFEVTA